MSMKATHTISPDILPNNATFSDDFFKRFNLNTSSYMLNFDENLKKNYSFPTLYNDVACAIGIFLCNFISAKKLMPKKNMIPLPVVIFSCYQYREVLGMQPYNEIAMAIPVIFPRFGFYVFSMPVTSKENQIRGNKIWGLPKITQDIDIEIKDDICRVKAFDRDQAYFTLDVPIKGKIKEIDSYINVYSTLEGIIKKSTTFFKGSYNFNTFLNKECLKIGTGSFAQILRSLKINPKPLQTRFTSSMKAAFTLPENCHASLELASSQK